MQEKHSKKSCIDMDFKIYIIENTLTYKKYVGITKNSLELRWCQHIKASSKNNGSKLHKAITEYGSECWTIRLLENTEASLASRKERFWIKHFNSLEHGYNSTHGGEMGKQKSSFNVDDFNSQYDLISCTPFENLSYNFYIKNKSIND